MATGEVESLRRTQAATDSKFRKVLQGLLLQVAMPKPGQIVQITAQFNSGWGMERQTVVRPVLQTAAHIQKPGQAGRSSAFSQPLPALGQQGGSGDGHLTVLLAALGGNQVTKIFGACIDLGIKTIHAVHAHGSLVHRPE